MGRKPAKVIDVTKQAITAKEPGHKERLTLHETREALYEKFRTNLRMLVASQNLSWVLASEKIGLKSGSRLSDLQYGRGTPSTEELILIARYFGVSMDDLIHKEAIIAFR